jgi:hypothetical protein
VVGQNQRETESSSRPAETLGPVVIRRSVRKQTVVAAGCLTFALLCIVLIRDPHGQNLIAGCLGLVVFGGGGMIYVVLGLTGHAHLTLDETGFSFGTPTRTYRYAWHDVTAFNAIRVGSAGNKMVGFSVTSKPSMMQTLNQGLTGAGGALPNVYTMSPEKLAALMNAYRDQALRQAQRGWSEPWDDNAAPRATFGRKG